MTYTPHVWSRHDKLDSGALNNLEQAVANFSVSQVSASDSTIAPIVASGTQTVAAVNSTIDAHLGGDSTGLVAAVANKTNKGEVVVIDTDYSSLEAALTATPAGATLEIRTAWTRTTAFTINKTCTVRFARGGSITNTTAGAHGIVIAANGVTLERPNLTGGGATTAGSKCAIQAVGTAAAPVDGITITRPTINGWDKFGIYLEQVTNFEVTGLIITNIAYAAMTVMSAIGGIIRRGLIQNLTMPSGFTNAYGIAVTRNSAQSITDAPRSQNIDIELVRVEGVPTWEGFDTHGGTNISWSRCYAYNCNVGFALVPSPVAGVDTYGPTMCTLDRCVAESSVSDGSRSNGFQVVGAMNGTTVNEAATATLSRCRSINHGLSEIGNSQGAGGFFFSVTSGTLVDMCTSVQSGFSAFQIYTQNQGIVLSNCVSMDVWSNSLSSACVAYIRGSDNTVTISNMKVQRGAKSATYVNSRGLQVSTAVNNTVVDAPGNGWANAGLAQSGATTVLKTAFFGGAPAVKPVVSGAKGSNAALGSLLAQLAALGLITDTTTT